MNDIQSDNLKEIKAISILLESINEKEQLDGDVITNIGNILAEKCILIEESDE